MKLATLPSQASTKPVVVKAQGEEATLIDEISTPTTRVQASERGARNRGRVENPCEDTLVGIERRNREDHRHLTLLGP